MDLDTARAHFTAASRAAQDQLLDVMNAQRDGRPQAIRVALAGLVDAQRAAVDAHQHLVEAANHHQADHHVQAGLDAEHTQLRNHLAAAEHELNRLTARPEDPASIEHQSIDLTIPVAASPGDMALVADRLHRAAHIADRAGTPLLVGPLLDAAHLLRRVAAGDGTAPGVQTASDLAAALLGYQDHLPLP